MTVVFEKLSENVSRLKRKLAIGKVNKLNQNASIFSFRWSAVLKV